MTEGHKPPPGEYARPAGVYRLRARHDKRLPDNHYVRGAQYHPEGFIGLTVGQKVDVELVPEPSNPYDSDAVALYVEGHRIGYVAADYSENWHRAVKRINKMGKAVHAKGIVNAIEIPSATVFLPWLVWTLRDEPPYVEECEALVAALSAEERALITARSPSTYEEKETSILHGHAVCAPSLDWRSLEFCRGIPLQLYSYLRNERGRLMHEDWIKQMQEVHRLRAQEQMTWKAIGERIGCASSTASKWYRQYLGQLPDDERLALEIALDNDHNAKA